MFHFNISVPNFISGYVIVQHHPNFIHIYIYTHTEQKPQAVLKNEKKTKPPTHNCQSDIGMKLK